MSDWNLINQCRIRDGVFASAEEDGFNGAFLVWAKRGSNRCLCKVIASNSDGWDHVSVSLADYPKVCPTWEVMCFIKGLFWEPEDCVTQFHPPASQYVNCHPGCLHLWRCTDGRPTPTPPAIMVGPKATCYPGPMTIAKS